MAKAKTNTKAKSKAKPKVKAKLKSGLKTKPKLKAKAVIKARKSSGSVKSKKAESSPAKSLKKKTSRNASSLPVKNKSGTLKSVRPDIKKEIMKPAEKKIRKFKPNKKVKYTASELRHFREIILKERRAIIESAKANMEALVDKESGEYKGDNLTYSSHMAEQGTDEMEREKNYMFVQRDEKYLGYLQDALIRIDQGTYGICVDCKEHPKNLCRTCPLIQKERLELVPITQHCIECKNLIG